MSFIKVSMQAEKQSPYGVLMGSGGGFAISKLGIPAARELREKFNVHYTLVLCELKIIGMVSVLGKWVLHELPPENCQQLVNCCKSLLTRQLEVHFLDRLVIVDEK